LIGQLTVLAAVVYKRHVWMTS